VSDLRRSAKGEPLAAGAEPDLEGIVDRLCVTADLPRPELVLEESREPNSWVVDLPRRRPRLHVTRALLDVLEPAELEAVIAHELAHLVHRDALVMTVTGLPGDALYKFQASGGSWTAGGSIGLVARFGSLALSRHRELTADRGAAMLTGRPSALASALVKMSGVLVPEDDLRKTGWQSLNVLPSGEDSRWWFWRTHPSVEKRVAALERMERRLAAARAGAPRD
jgi:heat shock protein HtpX